MEPQVRRTFKAKTGVELTLLVGGLDDSPEEQARPQGPPLLPMLWFKLALEDAKLARARRELEAKRAKQAQAKAPAKQAPSAPAEKPPVRAVSKAQVYFMRRQLDRLQRGLPLEITGNMSIEDVRAMASTPLDGVPERVSA